MSDEYLELTIDVFDSTGNQAKVRKTLTVRRLIDEILREFDDLDRRTPEAYALYLKGQSKPLDRDLTLAQLDVQAHDELELRYWRRSGRERLSGARRLLLRDESTGQTFTVEWQPALIGRSDVDPTHNELLAINVEPLPGSLRVSRRHAQITEERGIFYIESTALNNPTFLNNETAPLSGKRPLQLGDRIHLGRSGIVLQVVSMG